MPTVGELPGERAHLERFRRGDRRALGAVYRHYAPDIERLLAHGFTFSAGGERRRFIGLRDPMEAEDRLHDVFVAAFAERARLAYDGVSDYRPYLRTIARNVVLGRLRRGSEKIRRASAELESGGPADERLEAMLAAARDGGRPWEMKEIVAVAERFLDELDDEARAILEQRFRQRRPQAEVAAALGISAPTLRNRERRLFTRFFAHMQRHGYFDHRRARRDLRTRRDAVLALWIALGVAP